MKTIEDLKTFVRTLAPNHGPMPYELACLLGVLDELAEFHAAREGWPAEQVPPEGATIIGEWNRDSPELIREECAFHHGQFWFTRDDELLSPYAIQPDFWYSPQFAAVVPATPAEGETTNGA